MDLLISGKGDNLERAAAALAAFGAPATVVASVRALRSEEIAYLGAPPVRIDLLRSADGIDAEAVIERAEVVLVDGIAVPIILLDDLIANKRAAGRPQDLADLVHLERARSKARG